MVRHGRRIKRCGTCFERKVKCDQQQPYCQRCQNSGLECSGYHSNLKFVDENARFSGQAKGDMKLSRNTTTLSKAPVDASTTKCSLRREQTCQLQMRNLLPHQDTLFLPYTLSKLSPVTSRANGVVQAAILPSLLTGHESNVHQLCVQALVTTYFGRMMRESRICDQGLRLYSQALAQLRSEISGANSGTELGTIMSVLCLCIYENILLSQPMAWLMHYEGVARLVQSRGPQGWKGPKERKILQFARYFAILSAGHQRRRCFLDQPQWESTRCIPEGETPERIDVLYDIFAQVPGIVQDFDAIRQGTNMAPSTPNALRQHVQSVVDRIHDWLHDFGWDCDPGSDLKSGILPPHIDPTDSAALALCYAMLLCLSDPCQYLDVALVPNRPLPIDGPSVIHFLASEISQFAGAALRGEGSTNLALFLIYPLQIACFFLQNSESAVCRVQGIMDSVVADSCGFEMGRRRDWDDTNLDQGIHGFVTDKP
ncbi:hypothetical protein FZEAL_8487 [Fusarium zealandicum]|uniref:Zn(2)-C6 fungal-type domain-containing protein n=1 Tax=Fusarium zealandicum TaxID=1053134 RepID=A0A8H4UE34_9HYPO|nr:hypothetical protein FZEAL_8487 [Fusarium zealandicum]